MISSQAQDFIRGCNKYNSCEVSLQKTIQQQRTEWEDSVEIINTPGIESKEILKNCTLLMEQITPKEASEDTAILYFHGGGFAQGSAKTHHNICTIIADKVSITVFNSNYSLAPEQPYPAALNDGLEQYSIIREMGFNKIIVGGDSAGGNLALALILKLNSQGKQSPYKLFLISPWLDLSLSGETISTHDNKDPVTVAEDLQNDAGYYCSYEELKTPFVSPVFDKLENIPNTLIQVGSNEILLSDSLTAAEKLSRNGTDVILHVWEGMWHVWFAWMGSIPEADRALKELLNFIIS